MVMQALAVVVFHRHIGGAPSNTATVGVVVLTVVATLHVVLRRRGKGAGPLRSGVE
jgi:hypothetical protein